MHIRYVFRQRTMGYARHTVIVLLCRKRGPMRNAEIWHLSLTTESSPKSISTSQAILCDSKGSGQANPWYRNAQN
jgi:hypothetical protein